MSDVAGAAHGLYRAVFGGEPEWGYRAPGRVNLIGDHTDYNGGACLPIAIDRVCVAVSGPGEVSGSRQGMQGAAIERGRACVIDPACDELVQASSSAGTPAPGWARYVREVARGLMNTARERGTAMRRVSLAFAGDVPIGAGLSSSAALEISVCGALEQAWGIELTKRDRVLLCWKAEHRAGVPCGQMDQTASVYGEAGRAVLIGAAGEPALIPMPRRDQASILVANTKVRHELGDGAYRHLVEGCRGAAVKLGVESLCLADPSAVEDGACGLTDRERRLSRHAVREHRRALRAAELMVEMALVNRTGSRSAASGTERVGDTAWRTALGLLGGLMLESHRSLRDDYRVSCEELDMLVEVAMNSEGAYGARMTGAGFGGCIVALVQPGAVRTVEERLIDGFRRRHGRECDVMVVTASGGAGPVGMT
ncbi:MAG: hypothetical protein H7Y88_05040 [Phycisphaerales bacterium]|nr:hypothetical protein [Phycisphaerales bacterium]